MKVLHKFQKLRVKLLLYPRKIFPYCSYTGSYPLKTDFKIGISVFLLKALAKVLFPAPGLPIIIIFFIR